MGRAGDHRMRRDISVKVGGKCSSECRPDGGMVEVRDHDGRTGASATTSSEPWPDTAVLHYARAVRRRGPRGPRCPATGVRLSKPEAGNDQGTRLGHCDVTALLGMGEVYQASDTKLDQDVALKVLHEAFTSDPTGWPASSARLAQSRRSRCGGGRPNDSLRMHGSGRLRVG